MYAKKVNASKVLAVLIRAIDGNRWSGLRRSLWGRDCSLRLCQKSARHRRAARAVVSKITGNSSCGAGAAAKTASTGEPPARELASRVWWVLRATAGAGWDRWGLVRIGEGGGRFFGRGCAGFDCGGLDGLSYTLVTVNLHS